MEGGDLESKGLASARRARVLFVCVENSCRSQMAEGLARLDWPGALDAYSSGSRPSGKVNPKAVASMAEVGYDLGTHRSKPLNELPEVEWDLVVTMGCGDECPFVQARAREDWPIPDPKGMDAGDFADVRDDIRRRVGALAQRFSDSTIG